MANNIRSFFYELREKTRSLEQKIAAVTTAKKAYESAAEKCYRRMKTEKGRSEEAKAVGNEAAAKASAENMERCKADFMKHQKAAANCDLKLCELDLKKLKKETEKKAGLPIGLCLKLDQPKPKPKIHALSGHLKNKSLSLNNLSLFPGNHRGTASDFETLPTEKFYSLEKLNEIPEGAEHEQVEFEHKCKRVAPSAPPRKMKQQDFD